MLTKHSSSRDEIFSLIFLQLVRNNSQYSVFTQNFQSENHKEALQMWKEAQPLLPRGTLNLAQQFTNHCVRVGAFVSEPVCCIEALDEGRIIFDWNDGSGPCFTVIISEQAGFVYSGISSEREKRGQTRDLEEVTNALPDFVETGNQLWWKHVLQGSSLKRGKDLAGVDLHHYTLLPRTEGSRSLLPMEQSNSTYALRVSM